MSGALAGRRIVVPETRETEVLARLLERHGATVLRCPLIAIRDVPDPRPVEMWIEGFAASPPDDLILFTGEGLTRLLGIARRIEREAQFTAALGQARKITRGPKPAARLRALGLKPDIAVEPPTTEGIVATLAGEALAGRRVAVQLYPDNPHAELLGFLREKGALAEPVLPYVYASEAEDQRVLETIRAMQAGAVDLVAFTSSPQLRRLRQVAKAAGCDTALQEGLRRTRIAAVGPVVARAVAEAGGVVSIAPEENFHMKPMVNEIIAALG